MQANRLSPKESAMFSRVVDCRARKISLRIKFKGGLQSSHGVSKNTNMLLNRQMPSH